MMDDVGPMIIVIWYAGSAEAAARHNNRFIQSEKKKDEGENRYTVDDSDQRHFLVPLHGWPSISAQAALRVIRQGQEKSQSSGHSR